MGSNIFGIGQSALAAAQLGIATTGHNIANASTPGYNRQVVLQAANAPQNLGGSFIGQGVSVTQIQRQYNSFLAGQVNASQSAKNQADVYYSQISSINNLVADPTAGVTPALQDFFKAFQNLASSPNGTAGAAARQAALSAGESLAGRLNSLQGRLDQISSDVNGQISSVVGSINSYATELANLNDVIEKAQGVTGNGSGPNDLLDQRDQLITDLSKLTKVSVVPQGAKYNVFIGNGQPLVLGSTVNQLSVSQSLTDPSRSEVSYVSNGTSVLLPEDSFAGGKLGGLFDFRSSTLDVARNSIGRIAIGLATEFNNQQKLGVDLNGQVGGDFFTIGAPISTPSALNTSTAAINASITDASALTTSDYRLQFIGGNYKITRLSDGATQTSATLPLKMDGVNFQLAPPPAAAAPNAGDEFLIRPTAAGGSSIAIAIKDPAKLAAAAPVTTSFPTTNTGTGKVSVGVADSLVASGSTSVTATISAAKTDDSYVGSSLATPVTLTFASPANTISGFPAGATVSVKVGAVTTNYPPPATVPYTSGATISFKGVSFAVSDGAAPPANGDTFTLGPALPVAATRLTFNSAGNTLTGFPATANVTVTNNGTSTTYPAGTAIPYATGATISYNGVSFSLSGNPANGDVFDVAPNTNGSGDNRNAVLLSSIQTQNTLGGNTTTFQGAYAQFVSAVGNKAAQLKITSDSESKLLTQAVTAQQSESGVNLDEEATNLLRYQQAYQAAGKLMQIASTLFDSLLQLGR
ncbi:flagellar hook-associated protein FlgK [Undibacterium sp. CY18W]|uniref:Flagellar hook-associated protein 1 n=1 Tax=Undibacterium hunanense TaxID=2762292 RepID=A0ABR6ZKH6_9BURK|nr:flagellar hook-associated protein FlgK [Undibacterium hunanense]MBC3916400.1 flagellar hook-associated protein FlgK [Undibacterium hunanense]